MRGNNLKGGRDKFGVSIEADSGNGTGRALDIGGSCDCALTIDRRRDDRFDAQDQDTRLNPCSRCEALASKVRVPERGDCKIARTAFAGWEELSQGAGGDGSECAQVLDSCRQHLEDAVDLGFGGGLEQTEPETGAGACFIEAHGHEDMAGLGSAGVAG